MPLKLLLDEDYIGYVGDPVEFDLREIAVARRENAAYLINELKKIPEIQVWRDSLGESAIPLFVPIIVDPDVRGDLRRTLTEANIYCPIHWPVSPLHNEIGGLYDTELSLVCDQRYDIADMERMIGIIKRYFNR